jgi:outer membrane protease
MKRLFVLAFSFLTILGLAANDHNFSIGGSIGLLNGQAEEIVYAFRDTDDKLSELLWYFEPLVYAGLDIKYSWLKPTNKVGIFVNGSAKFGIPGNTGIMEDRDWVDRDYPVDYLNYYSAHDNRTESAILMDFDIGASFVIFQKFLLKAYISYHLMHFSWMASGGSVLYPDYNGGHSHLPSINVGSYEQNWHIVSPAIAFYGAFNRFFDIEISFEISPFVWCNAVDHHLLRFMTVTEKMQWGLFIAPSLLFSFTPTDHFALSFSFGYRYINGTRGNSVYSGIGVYQQRGVYSFTAKKIAGAGYSAFDFGIILKFKL